MLAGEQPGVRSGRRLSTNSVVPSVLESTTISWMSLGIESRNVPMLSASFFVGTMTEMSVRVSRVHWSTK